MRRERPGVRAARDELQHRSFELHEPALVQDPAHRPAGPRRGQERTSRRLVGEQMQVSLALLQVRVLQAVPLLRERPERLREHRPSGSTNTQSSPLLVRPHGAGGADDVAEVYLVEDRRTPRCPWPRCRRAGGRRRDRGSSRTPACPCRASARHGRRPSARRRSGGPLARRGAHRGRRRRSGASTPSTSASVSANARCAAPSRSRLARRAARTSASRPPSSARRVRSHRRARSKTRRRPWRVSHGSWWSIVRAVRDHHGRQSAGRDHGGVAARRAQPGCA